MDASDAGDPKDEKDPPNRNEERGEEQSEVIELPNLGVHMLPAFPTQSCPHPGEFYNRISGHYQFRPGKTSPGDREATAQMFSISHFLYSVDVAYPKEAQFIGMAASAAWFCSLRTGVFSMKGPNRRTLNINPDPRHYSTLAIAVSSSNSFLAIRTSDKIVQIHSLKSGSLIASIQLSEVEFEKDMVTLQFCCDSDDLSVAMTTGLIGAYRIYRARENWKASREFSIPTWMAPAVVMMSDGFIVVDFQQSSRRIQVLKFPQTTDERKIRLAIRDMWNTGVISTYDATQQSIFVHLPPTDPLSEEEDELRSVAMVDIEELVSKYQFNAVSSSTASATAASDTKRDTRSQFPSVDDALDAMRRDLGFSKDRFDPSSGAVLIPMAKVLTKNRNEEVIVVGNPYPSKVGDICQNSQYVVYTLDSGSMRITSTLTTTTTGRSRVEYESDAREFSSQVESLLTFVGTIDASTLFYEPSSRRLVLRDQYGANVVFSPPIEPSLPIESLIEKTPPTITFSNSQKFICIRWSASYYEVCALDTSVFVSLQGTLLTRNLATIVLNEQVRGYASMSRFCYDSDDIAIFDSRTLRGSGAMPVVPYRIYRASTNWREFSGPFYRPSMPANVECVVMSHYNIYTRVSSTKQASGGLGRILATEKVQTHMKTGDPMLSEPVFENGSMEHVIGEHRSCEELHLHINVFER